MVSLRPLTCAGLVTACCLAGSSSAFALFDAQVLIGKRWYSFDSSGGSSQNVSGQVVEAAVHLDPIPLVPVSFGLTGGLVTLKKEDLGTGVSEAGIVEAGLDLCVWIPMVPVVTPYARLNYPIVSKMTVKQDATLVPGTTVETASVSTLSGPHISAGLKVSPLPLIKFLVEGGMGMQTYKVDEIKSGGVKVTDTGGSEDAASKTLLVGVEVGF